MLKSKSLSFLAGAAALGALAVASSPARASVLPTCPTGGNCFTSLIAVPNSAISGTPGPYAQVFIQLINSTTADVTFTSLGNWTMGDGTTNGLNVNATTFTVGTVTESNSFSGFTPSFKQTNIGSQNIGGGVGTINLTIDNNDGFGDSATQTMFALTDVSGTWTSAANVLTFNSDHVDAAAHIFVCDQTPCVGSGTAVNTGFASEVPAPIIGHGLFVLLAVGGVLFGGKFLESFKKHQLRAA